MTDKTIDIFDNVSLGYIKLKVNRLAMSDSGRGVYLKYLNAADDVFEDIFGVEKVASKIVDARTPQAVASVIKKLDYQAFFELIRMKNNLIIMSNLIQLKYELKHDRGDKESKSTYKKVVSNLQRNYRIRIGSSSNYGWLLDATRSEPEYNYFDSVYDPDDSWFSDDEPFGSSGSSRNNREYFPREFLPDDDADEFSIHLKKVEGSRYQRPSTNDIQSLVEEEVRKRLDLERIDDKGRKSENLPSESVTNADMMKLLKSTINALNKTNSNVSNIASSLESVSSRVDDLAGATSDAIRELYDNLENELNELEDTDDGESPPAQKISNNGNFVRSSVEDALNQSVENALKG